MSTITHINPPELHTSPAFSQGTIIAEAGRTLYVGGQNGTDSQGRITGNTAAQAVRALRNVLSVLAATGAGVDDVAKLTIYLAADADLNAAFTATGETWGHHPTAITVLRVAGLARRDALVEIDAIATLP